MAAFLEALKKRRVDYSHCSNHASHTKKRASLKNTTKTSTIRERNLKNGNGTTSTFFTQSQKKTTAANCSAQNVNHVFPRCTFSLVVRRYDSTQHTFTFFFSACFFTIFLPLIPSIHLREYKHTALFRVTVPSLLQEILFTLHQFFHSPRFCTMIIIPHHHQPAFVIVLYQRERTGCPQSVFYVCLCACVSILYEMKRCMRVCACETRERMFVPRSVCKLDSSPQVKSHHHN